MDPAALEALEANFESAAETLVTMREARTRLQEIRKDRGYKKADGKTAAAFPAIGLVTKNVRNLAKDLRRKV